METRNIYGFVQYRTYHGHWYRPMCKNCYFFHRKMCHELSDHLVDFCLAKKCELSDCKSKCNLWLMNDKDKRCLGPVEDWEIEKLLKEREVEKERKFNRSI